MEITVAGVDDAGRGSVIGPLVIAGVLLLRSGLEKLQSLGVKDSKQLTPTRRVELAEQIKCLTLKHTYVKITPTEIDDAVLRRKKFFKLNFLEAKAMAQVITELKPKIVYVDASDIMADRFGRQIEGMLPFKVKIVSEHNADSKYIVVSAASILAKVQRDTAISEIKANYGEVGSGYPADPRTVTFLQHWIKEYGSYPSFVRKSWKTAEKIRHEYLERGQKSLG